MTLPLLRITEQPLESSGVVSDDHYYNETLREQSGFLPHHFQPPTQMGTMKYDRDLERTLKGITQRPSSESSVRSSSDEEPQPNKLKRGRPKATAYNRDGSPKKTTSIDLHTQTTSFESQH